MTDVKDATDSTADRQKDRRAADRAIPPEGCIVVPFQLPPITTRRWVARRKAEARDRGAVLQEGEDDRPDRVLDVFPRRLGAVLEPTRPLQAAIPKGHHHDLVTEHHRVGPGVGTILLPAKHPEVTHEPLHRLGRPLDQERDVRRGGVSLLARIAGREAKVAHPREGCRHLDRDLFHDAY